MIRLLNDRWFFAKTANEARPREEDFAPVDLPHDWLIHQADDLYEPSDGWYRRTLRVEDAADGLRRLVRFDGVYMNCDVLVNGQLVCTHHYGYTAFDADLTDFLRSGDNELTVHVRFQPPCSRWYSGAGIYRDVTLYTLPEEHIVPDGVYVHSQETPGGWVMHITVETVGRGLVFHRLMDHQGKNVAEGQGTDCLLTIPEPRLWRCGDPYLYTLESVMGDQTVTQRVGLRTTAFDPDRGFLLNHEPVKLHGVCLHHDLGLLGAAFHEKAARRQLRLMQQMGVNALRTAHNPPARQVMDLCDEMGILVLSESFDMWYRPKNTYDFARFFAEDHAADIASWVRRDRNHPSVIMWSIGNEILDTHVDPKGPDITRRLAEKVRRHDPAGNGAVTLGLNYMPWEGAQKCVDVIKNGGYNYAEKLYEGHHRQYPDWFIYGSETASLVHTRGVYHFPADTPILSDADLQCSALGNSLTSWGTKDICRLIMDDLHCSFSGGQFLWSGIDYLGEPTPYHTRSSYFGYVDTAGFPKDLYHLFQAWWTEQPMVHIGVHWDWNRGQLIDVNVMTAAPRVELFLNGRSLGIKDVRPTAEECLPRWRVPFQPGELRAVAYNADGTVMAEDCRRTPGDSAALAIRAEDTVLHADGRDMTFLEITAVDAHGWPVDTAADRVTLTVTGPGLLLGMDNGDSTDTDGYVTNCRRLFMGKIAACIAATEEAGEIIVEAAAPGLATARVILLAEAALPVAGASRHIGCAASDRKEGVHARRIEIIPLDETALTPDHPEVRFRWRLLPDNAMAQEIRWEVTNAAAIADGCASLTVEEDIVTVHALGDGVAYLRAMCCNGYDHPRIISQLEIPMTGFGTPNRDPYGFITGGLYDLSFGEISPGNDKGVAFARDGRSMAGFSRVDFGPDGSDEINLPVFALDGGLYEIALYLGDPREGGELLALLPYQKPSKWNVYQPETYRLPRRLTGVQTLCFVMEKKIHLRGFSFTRQSRAWRDLSALEADVVYGDSFTRTQRAVENIGNNVTLVFERMDFGDCRRARLILMGATPLAENPITLRIQSAAGEEITAMANFARGSGSQSFPVEVLPGPCQVSFVFLPGSQFDFVGFRFERE